MKKIVMLALMSIAVQSMASEWKVVISDGGKAASLITVSAGYAYTPDPTKNEYPVDYPFPADDIMYWKKVGNDWVAMNADEKLAVDNAKKQKTLDAALEDVDMDALLDVIAKAVKNNLKTKDEIKQAFKDSVDPKKADKKDKTRK